MYFAVESWGVRAFEHFFPCPLVPNLGILTTNFAPNCGFLKPRKGYFIRIKVFSSPNGEEFDSKNCNFLCPKPTPLSMETLIPATLHVKIDFL